MLLILKKKNKFLENDINDSFQFDLNSMDFKVKIFSKLFLERKDLIVLSFVTCIDFL